MALESTTRRWRSTWSNVMVIRFRAVGQSGVMEQGFRYGLSSRNLSSGRLVRAAASVNVHDLTASTCDKWTAED